MLVFYENGNEEINKKLAFADKTNIRILLSYLGLYESAKNICDTTLI